MNNHDDRVERQISALDAKAKAALLNKHIGPTLPGSEPDPESDAAYLRGIVRDQLKEADAKEAGGFATLDARIAKLERRKPGIAKAELDAILGGIADVVGEHIAKAFASSGYMKHEGTYDAERAYAKGACVLHDGGTWLAIAEVAKGARPSRALEWKLVVKESR